MIFWTKQCLKSNGNLTEIYILLQQCDRNLLDKIVRNLPEYCFSHHSYCTINEKNKKSKNISDRSYSAIRYWKFLILYLWIFAYVLARINVLKISILMIMWMLVSMKIVVMIRYRPLILDPCRFGSATISGFKSHIKTVRIDFAAASLEMIFAVKISQFSMMEIKGVISRRIIRLHWIIFFFLFLWFQKESIQDVYKT